MFLVGYGIRLAVWEGVFWKGFFIGSENDEHEKPVFNCFVSPEHVSVNRYAGYNGNKVVGRWQCQMRRNTLAV